MKITPYTYQKAKQIETMINKALVSRGVVTYIRPNSAQPQYSGPMVFKLSINWKWAMKLGDLETTPVNTLLGVISDLFYKCRLSNNIFSLSYDENAKMDVIEKIRDRSPDNPKELVETKGRYTLIFNLPEVPGEARMSKNIEAAEFNRRDRKLDEDEYEGIKETVIKDLDFIQNDVESIHGLLAEVYKEAYKIRKYSGKLPNIIMNIKAAMEGLMNFYNYLDDTLETTLPNARYTQQQPKQENKGQQPPQQEVNYGK